MDLPHDWSIEGPYSQKNAAGTAFLPAGIAWYRKTFQLPASLAGRKVSIRFDGVYRDSIVWINGELLGSRPYGYATFEYDLTPHVHLGGAANVAQNVVAALPPATLIEAVARGDEAQLTRAQVNADLNQAIATHALQRTDYDDGALVARRAAQHAATSTLAQRVKAVFSRTQS